MTLRCQPILFFISLILNVVKFKLQTEGEEYFIFTFLSKLVKKRILHIDKGKILFDEVTKRHFDREIQVFNWR